MEAGCSGPCAIPNADENPEDPATIADDDRTYLFKLDLTAAYRQVMVYMMCLYMCHTMWWDKVNLDRRGRFGDASMVEGFQAITMLVLAASRAAIRGHKGIRALLPELTHVWQWVRSWARHTARLQVSVFRPNVANNPTLLAQEELILMTWLESLVHELRVFTQQPT